MGKIRVLVVDDSMFMRRMISDLLSQDTELEVVGAARNGQEGLELARRLQPDVITLDVEMPVMDGVTMLQKLMQEQPTPVLMLSSLTTEGAEVTLRCLELGAVDFVAKPSGSISLDIYKISSQIIEKVKAVARARLAVAPPTARPVPVSPLPSVPAGRPTHEAPLVVIGSSTGGPRALHTVMSSLPANLHAKILLIQHMPEGFTRSLAERLDRSSAFTVREAQGGETLEAGVAYLAQGGKHLIVERGGKIRLTQDPPVHGVRPAVDVALLSVAQHYQGAVIVAILTGMGSDGAAGLRALHAKGAYTIAEDESTSVVFGMPRAAIQTGCVKRIAPLHQIAEAITEGVRELCNKYRAA
ncbi:MAG: chemotaxis response regulator protein-glutamate methylesterase [Fimbriimonadales bacterium]|nr:chemotaxis response regulator protein-glutamate methylesterase [Fimbriimonadales bacterium]